MYVSALLISMCVFIYQKMYKQQNLSSIKPEKKPIIRALFLVNPPQSSTRAYYIFTLLYNYKYNLSLHSTASHQHH